MAIKTQLIYYVVSHFSTTLIDTSCRHVKYVHPFKNAPIIALHQAEKTHLKILLELLNLGQMVTGLALYRLRRPSKHHIQTDGGKLHCNARSD